MKFLFDVSPAARMWMLIDAAAALFFGRSDFLYLVLVVWAIDALRPQGHGTLLYVLYDALSGTPVSALQASYPTAEILQAWIEPYRAICLPVLATLSDGENQIIAALKGSWPDAPHQRCQSHVLGNLAEAVLKEDTDLRGWMKQDLGGLAAVPTEVDPAEGGVQTGQAPESPLF